MTRLILALFVCLLASVSLYLIFIGSAETAGYGISIAMNILPLLLFIGPIFIWFFGMIKQHGRSWYLVGDDVERGPFSLYQLGRMKKENELPNDARIRRRWSSRISGFDIITRPPARVAGGLVGLALGAIGGGVLGYFLFGQIITPTEFGVGHWVNVEHVFEKPSAKGSWNGVLGKSVVDSAANSNIPGVREIGSILSRPGEQTDAAIRTYFSAIDRIRFSSVFGAILGSMISAAMLRESYSIARVRKRKNPLKAGKS